MLRLNILENAKQGLATQVLLIPFPMSANMYGKIKNNATLRPENAQAQISKHTNIIQSELIISNPAKIL